MFKFKLIYTLSIASYSRIIVLKRVTIIARYKVNYAVLLLCGRYSTDDEARSRVK